MTPNQPTVVEVVIRVGIGGGISLSTSGPYRGKAGLLVLLDQAKELVEQMK